MAAEPSINFQGGPRNTRRVPDSSSIIGDRNQNKKPNQPIIVDTVTGQTLYLQTLPQEIDIQPNTTWVALASAGRNEPFFHYTGAEDTIEFTINWYANDELRTDVLQKCKWLESLSKADGYISGPQPVLFIFGELFKDSKFLIVDAGYKLSLFNREFGMMPGLAVQSLVMKKIANKNPERKDIQNIYY